MRSQAGSGALASARKDSAENSAGVFCVGRKLSASASIIELVFEVMAWNGSSGSCGPEPEARGQEVISMCGEQEPANVAEALVHAGSCPGCAGHCRCRLAAHAGAGAGVAGAGAGRGPHTAARAQFLAAFAAQDGYEDDGQGSARTWLRWQTRVTKAAAAGSVGWMRRLAAHPVIAAALADGRDLRLVGAGDLRLERAAARGHA